MALDIDYSSTAVPTGGKLTSLILDEDTGSNGKTEWKCSAGSQAIWHIEFLAIVSLNAMLLSNDLQIDYCGMCQHLYEWGVTIRVWCVALDQ